MAIKPKTAPKNETIEETANEEATTVSEETPAQVVPATPDGVAWVKVTQDKVSRVALETNPKDAKGAHKTSNVTIGAIAFHVPLPDHTLAYVSDGEATMLSMVEDKDSLSGYSYDCPRLASMYRAFLATLASTAQATYTLTGDKRALYANEASAKEVIKIVDPASPLPTSWEEYFSTATANALPEYRELVALAAAMALEAGEPGPKVAGTISKYPLDIVFGMRSLVPSRVAEEFRYLTRVQAESKRDAIRVYIRTWMLAAANQHASKYPLGSKAIVAIWELADASAAEKEDESLAYF